MIPASVQEKIIKYASNKGYRFSTSFGEINIIYIEGMNPDGSVNNDAPNMFNDLRCIFDHQLKCINIWSATTEPGRWYTDRPMNPHGAFRIAFGQYKAWQVGTHGTSERHEALIQVADVDGYRDANKDMLRTGDKKVRGVFGINQHWGYDYPVTDISKASAGCLVGRLRQGHREFMSLVKSDPRFRVNPNHTFWTTVIPGDEL